MNNDFKLMIAFRLLVRDKVEHEKTVLRKLDLLIARRQRPADGDVEGAVKALCAKFNIDFKDVIKHALEMYDDDTQGNVEKK